MNKDSVYVLTIPCAPPIKLIGSNSSLSPLFLKPLTITDIFTVHLFLPFPECDIIGHSMYSFLRLIFFN